MKDAFLFPKPYRKRCLEQAMGLLTKHPWSEETIVKRRFLASEWSKPKLASVSSINPFVYCQKKAMLASL